MSDLVNIAITTGDTDGIGLEISSKTIESLNLEDHQRIFIFRDKKAPSQYLDIIKKNYAVKTITKIEDLCQNFSEQQIVDIATSLSPTQWVDTAIDFCKSNFFKGMVTAPLSKLTMKKNGYTHIGHTQLLKDRTQTSNLFMGFMGKHFNVLLVTDHIPLSEVPKHLSEELLHEALFHAQALKNISANNIRQRPVAFLGLNPHNGEDGLIGSEEGWIQHFLLKNKCSGPLVPDAAFLSQNLQKYSVFVCLYHDQGLIPFKMAHQHSGVHITLGLPFVRTSVDHGTAKDIAHKNVADFRSMKEATELAFKLCQKGE